LGKKPKRHKAISIMEQVWQVSLGYQ